MGGGNSEDTGLCFPLVRWQLGIRGLRPPEAKEHRQDESPCPQGNGMEAVLYRQSKGRGRGKHGQYP